MILNIAPCAERADRIAKPADPLENRVYDVAVLALLPHRHIRHMARCLNHKSSHGEDNKILCHFMINTIMV